MKLNLDDYFNYLKNFFKISFSDVEVFKNNPLPYFLILFLVYLVFKRKFNRFFTVIIVFFLFSFGYFYGIVQPLENQAISISIFAFSTLASFILIIYFFFIKGGD